MTIEEQAILDKHRDLFVTMTVKFLDTIYDSKDEQKMLSAPIYEDLRRVLLDKKEPTTKQWYLLALLSSYNTSKFKQLSLDYNKAAIEFEIVTADLQKCANSRTQNLDISEKS